MTQLPQRSGFLSCQLKTQHNTTNASVSDHNATARCLCFKGESYRELQSFIKETITLAVEEGIGASCLGYSYPGQTGFLQKQREKEE